MGAFILKFSPKQSIKSSFLNSYTHNEASSSLSFLDRLATTRS